nr:MAG TPA: hypothetical protein [Caudoviricetes sp.]
MFNCSTSSLVSFYDTFNYTLLISKINTKVSFFSIFISFLLLKVSKRDILYI